MNANPSPAALADQSLQTAFLKMETICCPLCTSEKYRPVLSGKDHLHHIPGTFQIVRCTECRHSYLNPRPIVPDIIKCYPDEYGPHQPESAVDASEPSSKSDPSVRQPWYLRKWVRAIPGLRGFYYWLMNDWGFYIPDVVETCEKRVLEIGCGTGQFLEKLRSAGWKATGVELAKHPAAIARNRRFEVHAGTLESAGFSSATFDSIHLYMVLEHVPYPKETLTEIYRLLEPGGWLVFSVPNFACWERFLLRDYSLGIELPRHLQHFSPATIRSLLNETRFKDVRIIHQRNQNNVIGGLGMWFREHFPRWSLGPKLIDLTNNHRLWANLLVAPFAKIAALFRQSGRLTVIARKPHTSTHSECGSIAGGTS